VLVVNNITTDKNILYFYEHKIYFELAQVYVILGHATRKFTDLLMHNMC
jgi:hypothetical protein